MELWQLTQKLKEIKTENDFIAELQKNPRLVLPIRLSLNLSQREFVGKTKISQVSLIKYEKGKAKFIAKSNAEIIKDLFLYHKPTVDYNKLIRTYKRFKEMQTGKAMTPKRARYLQKIWQEKTTRKQRSEWGVKGARITNEKGRYTQQEKEIMRLLDKNKVNYKSHFEITTKKIKINVDFVVYKKTEPVVVIETTERETNLYEYALSYCYKAKLLKEAYPNIKLIFIGSNKLSESAKELLKNEFDYVLEMSKVSSILGIAQ